MTFTPTAEQDRAVAAAKTGENLVITAGAGTGKTSTLRLIADALAPRKGVYIAYNKAIQVDASKSFPRNVECRTAHSLAFRAVGKDYKSKLNAKRLTGRQIAALLDIDRGYALPEDRELSPQSLGSLVMQTIGRWCHSADRELGVKHVPGTPGTEDVSFDLAEYIVGIARKAWATDLLPTDRGSLPFSHDMYVKVWALGNPSIAGDFILYDEAQDADPCIAGVVLAQKGKQLIAVGDESQAIYGWRGATDAMKNWPAAHRVTLAKSFRFGPAIAAEANVFLGLLDAPLRIEGAGSPDSVSGPLAPTEADAILTRTNASLIQYALDIHYTRSFAIVGGTVAIEKFADAAEALLSGRSASWHADLGAFKTWNDVVDYVNNDEGGTDIRAMVNMVRDYGVETLREVCRKAVSEDRADVVLSTAHKSKGREWGKVLIASDFTRESEDGEKIEPTRAEQMLMYVAVTRAKTHIDASALSQG
jgi:hypothetical protein